MSQFFVELARRVECPLVLLFVLLIAAPAAAQQKTAGPTTDARSDAGFRRIVRPFLMQYCADCHGPEEQKGERRFDTLTGVISDDNSLVELQDILDQLNLGEMPPEDETQPPDATRREVIGWLTSRISEHHRSRRANHRGTVLRRLNAREYRNTVRDLLGLNMTMFDPTATFPRDQTSDHLDNVGETLVTSGHLLARYLDAADQVVEKAIMPVRQPAVQTWTFRDGFRQQPEIDQVHRKTNKFEHMTLYDVIGADKHEGAYGPILAFRDGVPFDGTYEIRILAEAVNREHPYDPGFLGTDPAEPLRLGIRPGNVRVGALHKPQPVEPLLAEIELADERKWYTVRVPLDAGYTPRFTFRNGLMDVRNLWARLLSRYKDQFPPRKNKGIVEARFNAIKFGKLPQIHIHEIEIRGPLFDEWPRPGQRAVLGDDFEHLAAGEPLPEATLRQHLHRFATEAYRRPATDEEIDRIVALVQERQRAGRSPVEAFADGVKGILCSPGFLYLEQPNEEGLSPHALAARLSYFLWSSTPDAELDALATSGRINQDATLEAQVDRMLQDRRSDAFVDGFLGTWLTLSDLGSTPPDRASFRAFYHYDLGDAMRRETVLFTRHLIDNNLPVTLFLDSDFTFVNKPLARLYGVEPPRGTGFERVALTSRRRGGLLGQASVLTVTANGIDTSPVVRGVWLLENILGTPPSPPPPDVEPLDPDIRGARTIRDQLRKHRDVASCNDCHRKIDPLGFALENFDPIGRWRETYGRKNKVDASGTLPGGHRFEDIEGLKTILVEQQSLFRRALASRLLAYATGRHTTPADRPAIDRILEDHTTRGDGVRDLLKLIVLSPPFRSR